MVHVLLNSHERQPTLAKTVIDSRGLCLSQEGANRQWVNVKRAAALKHSPSSELDFMRNTFRVAFVNYLSSKRRYMFSVESVVDDPVMRHNRTVLGSMWKERFVGDYSITTISDAALDAADVRGLDRRRGTPAPPLRKCCHVHCHKLVEVPGCLRLGQSPTNFS